MHLHALKQHPLQCALRLRLQGMERLKQLCNLPGQLMDPLDVRWRTFLSENALVADPEAELAGDWLGKNWSQDEKRIFMDKYLQFPKVRDGSRRRGQHHHCANDVVNACAWGKTSVSSWPLL